MEVGNIRYQEWNSQRPEVEVSPDRDEEKPLRARAVSRVAIRMNSWAVTR